MPETRPGSPRVLLVGGAPLSGKSTLARALAARLGYACLSSTDDLALAVRAMTDRTSCPGLHYWTEGQDYREYYVANPLDRVIADAECYHVELWPALRAVISAHLLWAEPFLLEGWAITPARVATLPQEGLGALWLVAEREVLEARLRADVDFWQGASNEERFLSCFLARSAHFDARLREEAANLGAATIEVTASTSPAEVCERALAALGIR